MKQSISFDTCRLNKNTFPIIMTMLQVWCEDNNIDFNATKITISISEIKGEENMSEFKTTYDYDEWELIKLGVGNGGFMKVEVIKNFDKYNIGEIILVREESPNYVRTEDGIFAEKCNFGRIKNENEQKRNN